MNCDLPQFFKRIEVFLPQVPYLVHLSFEKYFQTIFYMLLRILGADISMEELSNNGRIDAVLENDKYICIFEFKMQGSPQDAINQIEIKKYYQKYLESGKEIHLV